jgi:hypothetical protein
MGFMKNILFVVLIVSMGTSSVCAQSKNKKTKPKSTPTVAAVDDTSDEQLNKVDAQHRKQGLWFHDMPALRGEPAYKEFGKYQDDQRVGIWYKLNAEGALMSIENYRRGVLHGEVQYYVKGRLSCIGHYRGLNPENKLDSIWVTDPETLLDTMVVVSTERGSLKHGIWRYYDPFSGKLTREEEYQVDDLIKSEDFEYISKSDSAYIEKRKAMLPHNTTPSKKSAKRKSSRYTY